MIEDLKEQDPAGMTDEEFSEWVEDWMNSKFEEIFGYPVLSADPA